MEMVPHNPNTGVFAPTGDSIHAIEVRSPDRLLFIAGTVGLDPAGAPGATLADQLELIWANLRTILASAGMTVDNIVRLTSYLRSTEYATANARARKEALGGRLVPTTAIVAETLVSAWLVEVEAIAAR